MNTQVKIFLFCLTQVQFPKISVIPLVNKPYVNEVTLNGQNSPFECCEPLDFWYPFLKGLDLSLLKI